MLKDMRSYNKTIALPDDSVEDRCGMKAARAIVVGSLLCLSLSSISAQADPGYGDEHPEIPVETPVEAKIRDSRNPKFWDIRPTWAFELSSSLNALGGNALTVDQGTNPTYAFAAAIEYQPPDIQKYGVFGIGPIFEVFPIFQGSSTPDRFSLLAGGFQFRYQARYFQEQPLVPMAAYSVEYFRYRFTSGPTGNTWLHGPTVGLWLLLNMLEPDTAAQFYINSGVVRSYVTLEYRILTGSGTGISVSGGSFYFGLRCEF